MSHPKIRSMTALILAFLMASSVFSSCSTKLPDETLPSTEATTTTTETTPEETEPVETTETTPSKGPTSTAKVTVKPVEVHGQLSVKGTDMVDEHGDKVQLRGMSTYMLNGCGSFVSAATVQTLAEDWGCDIIRLAMATEGDVDNYTAAPEKYFNEICKDVDLCIKQGVYVIVDWHILIDGDPNKHTDEAVDFFSRISALYKDCPNIIYEICNEPNKTRYDDPDKPVDWDCIKPYAKKVIKAIRANDPDNIIVVGTPTWSRDVDIASKSPLKGDNLMYTLHFYAGSHGQEYRDKILEANKNGIAIFVTEWGTTVDSGKGQLYLDETREWIDFMKEHNISWCNWSIGGSAAESSNALKFRSKILTVAEKFAGHWCDEFISDSGLFIRDILLDKE